MSQQEMEHGEMSRSRPGASYGGYEGVPHSSVYGEKLSGHTISGAATAGQRLALAIVSLGMLMIMTFGLIVFAAGLHAPDAPDWAIIPILFVMVLFTSAAVIINVVFNRRA